MGADERKARRPPHARGGPGGARSTALRADDDRLRARGPVAPNPLARDFAVGTRACDTAWVSDLTYVATAEGFLYLAFVLDLASRRVVGWAMADTLVTALPLAALRMAITQRRPAPEVIHHSDRGSQYCSRAYRAVLGAHGFPRGHESQGRLLGQCRGGELLRDAGARASGARSLRHQKTRSAARAVRVHRTRGTIGNDATRASARSAPSSSRRNSAPPKLGVHQIG